MTVRLQKPQWLNKKINLKSNRKMKILLKELRLHTVCEESLCPNISECFSRGVATFMILGNICTRGCRFCAVKKGKPDTVDYSEPQGVKQAAEKLGLSYVVITSVTRDDLADGGAELFSLTASALKELPQVKKVELLIPDFLGKKQALEKVAFSKADVIGHNLETVSRLYEKVRPQADYQRSLDVLSQIGEMNKNILLKSGIMVGLGEKEEEVYAALADLKKAGCVFVSIGQYLNPSCKHYPVAEYVPLERFSRYEQFAYKLGFKHVKSSPYVRSSYLADTYLTCKR